MRIRMELGMQGEKIFFSWHKGYEYELIIDTPIFESLVGKKIDDITNEDLDKLPGNKVDKIIQIHQDLERYRACPKHMEYIKKFGFEKIEEVSAYTCIYCKDERKHFGSESE